MTSEVLGDVRTVLASTTGVDPGEVTAEKTFAGDLGIDSMTLLEAIVAIEDRFGVLIPDDDWARFSTVGDLVEYLQRIGVGTPA